MLSILPDIKIPFTEPVFIIALLLVVLLIAPVVFERIRVPAIVGLLILGAVIGENGLRLLPAGLEFTMLGTFGLLYLMFLAGLEIDLIDFLENKKKSIVFGLLSYALPFVLGWSVSVYLLGWDQPSSLLMAAMLSSHTLISYPILGKLGIVNKPIVTIIIGGTIIADVLALVSLEVVTNFVGSTSYFNDLLHFAITFTLFFLFIFLLLPQVIKIFINYYEGNIQVQYIFIIALLAVSAALAHLLGLEPIIGAFFSGIVLNRFVQRDSPLFKRIEFIGNTFFIPIFLVSVGVLVNMKIVIESPAVIITTLILLTAALAGKYLASLATKLSFRYTHTENNLMFGLSVSRAASALAIVLVGFNMGILNETIINHTIILILVTSIISTYFTQYAGEKISLSEDSEERSKVIRERILVPVANPETMENLLDFATLIKKENDPNPVYSLSVLVGKNQRQKDIEQRYMQIDKVIKRLHSDTRFEIVTRLGMTATDGILKAVQELMISSIIIGWHEKYTPIDTLFGSILEKLLKQTEKMIFVVKTPYSFNYIDRIFVFIPERAEGERGFTHWFGKVTLLSKRLKSKVIIYSAGQTVETVNNFLEANNISSMAEINEIGSYQGPPEEVRGDKATLFIFIRSRKNMLSYNKDYEREVIRMTEKLRNNDIIYIYPEQL